MSNLDKNRPVNMVDSQGRAIVDSVDYLSFKGDYDGSNNLIYCGFARPGTSVDAPNWQISKFTYDVSNNPTARSWPANSSGVSSNDYEFSWTNRASYIYS